MGDDWVLSVDVGTSRSAGAMANGTVISLEVEGNRWMPSMVLLDPEGTLVVGSAADYQAGVYPDRVERTPKRHLGGPAPLLLGGSPVEVPDAIASLIRVFIKEGSLRRGGQPPAGSVLTHPVRWGEERKAALTDAAQRAGLVDPALIEEPVAAAVHYVGDQVEIGQCVGVYDLGGGTFDTAVLQRTDDGFETIGAPGGDEFIGGEHFDFLIYEFLGSCLAEEDPSLWEQVQVGEERKWTRAAVDLMVQARRAKEAVSSYPSTQVVLPLVDRDVVFTRLQLEDMIRDQVEATVDEMATTIASAGMDAKDLAALYLVGGSSRIPLVTQLMTERFGDRIATRDEPKSVVALGAAQVARLRAQPSPEPSPAATPDPAVAPVAAAPAPSATPRSWPAGPAAGPPLPGNPPPPPGWLGHAHRPAPPPPSAPPPPPLSDAWRIDLHNEVYATTAAGPSIHASDASGQLHQTGLDGRWRWSTQLPGPVYGRPTHVGDLVVVGCGNGQLVALDQARGRERFRLPLAGPVIVAPHGGYDAVVVADDSGTVSAFGTRDGRVRWVLPIGSNVRATMATVGPAVLVAVEEGNLYRIDQASGTVAWAFPTPARVTAGPMVAEDTAFVAGTNAMVYGIDVASGQARWGTTLAGAVDGNGAVWGGVVVVADRSGMLSALDRATGKVAWTLPTDGPNPTGVVLGGDTLYVDNGAGSLLVIDARAHCETSRVEIAPGSWQSPTLAGSLVLLRAGTMVRALHAVR